MAEGVGVEIHRDERDGVPVFWGEGGRELTGALMFRVGTADEIPATRGLTHLIEHLALYGLGARPPYEYNAVVESLRTIFYARGTPEQVVAFMLHVCASIRALPLDRLDAEARVLRAEAAEQSFSLFDHHVWLRLGTQGPGMGTIPQYALQAPDPGRLSAWALERFTRSNAAAWFMGPIPPGLSFGGLPQGERRPCPKVVGLSDVRLPAYCSGPRPEIAVSFVTERDDWIAVPWRFATLRLHERLRWKKGLTYAFRANVVPIGSTVSHSMILTQCQESDAPEVEAGILSELDELAQKGLTGAELAEAAREAERADADPDSLPGQLDDAAKNELLGYRVRSSAERLAELRAMTPESSAAAVSRALPTALLTLPPNCPAPSNRFNPYPGWSRTVATGARFYPASRIVTWFKKWPQLIVGPRAASLVLGEERAITVAYDACAGAVVDLGGDLHLMGLDGFNFWIKPAEWHDGRRARDAVLEALSGHLVLRMGPR